MLLSVLSSLVADEVASLNGGMETAVIQKCSFFAVVSFLKDGFVDELASKEGRKWRRICSRFGALMTCTHLDYMEKVKTGKRKDEGKRRCGAGRELSFGSPSEGGVVNPLRIRSSPPTRNHRRSSANHLVSFPQPSQTPEVGAARIFQMTSSTLRRRLHHGDLDGRREEHLDGSNNEDLNEPLLGRHEPDDRRAEERVLDDLWDDEKRKARMHWTLLFSQLITQWVQWLANVVLGSTSLLGRYLPLSSFSQNGSNRKFLQPVLSPLQEERLRNLQQRLAVPFDGSCPEHQDALRQLWRLSYPDRELPSLKSELWKDMGWQGTDPSTDFRGGGFISLENLIYFAKKYPESFHNLLHKKDGLRAAWEYPFAVAGINISFMLAQMLDLQTGKPSSLAGVKFLELLGGDDTAFDNLYCVAFRMMDAQWLAKRASYMEFNDVLKSTRTQLERELSLEDISSIRDLPAFNLL
ncbi:hypothetical protein MLD38_004532 [Melastoma candidum]|uniref:Uncharacterized protein n=1 Tax=Melastoma candidum TaxID=119954 RepID=A0ACB9S9W5_9MYRT|nr:hypothetical protein MLD38_004532 [Melastoma candidum]